MFLIIDYAFSQRECLNIIDKTKGFYFDIPLRNNSSKQFNRIK